MLKNIKTLLADMLFHLIIFKGDSSLIGKNNNIVQQIDIIPTILDQLLDTQNHTFSFGKSMFGEENWAVHKAYNEYRLNYL